MPGRADVFSFNSGEGEAEHLSVEARRRNILRRAKLPVAAPELGAERYLDLMGHDKKVEGGKIKFILLKKPGEAFICNQYDAASLNAVLSTPAQTHA